MTEKQIVHGNICPRKLVYNLEAQAAKIIDFGAVTFKSRQGEQMHLLSSGSIAAHRIEALNVSPFSSKTQKQRRAPDYDRLMLVGAMGPARILRVSQSPAQDGSAEDYDPLKARTHCL